MRGRRSEPASHLPASERPARACDTACAAPLLRDASAGGGGGSALAPRPAGPRQPLAHPALHGGRYGAADGGVETGPSAALRVAGDKAAGLCRSELVSPSAVATPRS